MSEFAFCNKETENAFQSLMEYMDAKEIEFTALEDKERLLEDFIAVFQDFIEPSYKALVNVENAFFMDDAFRAYIEKINWDEIMASYLLKNKN